VVCEHNISTWWFADKTRRAEVGSGRSLKCKIFNFSAPSFFRLDSGNQFTTNNPPSSGLMMTIRTNTYSLTLCLWNPHERKMGGEVKNSQLLWTMITTATKKAVFSKLWRQQQFDAIFCREFLLSMRIQDTQIILSWKCQRIKAE